MVHNYENFRKRAVSVLVLVLVACLPWRAMASELIGGRYIAATGTRIILDVEIASPNAVNLIVQQYFPAGAEVVSTSPAAVKVQQGQATWLIKGVQPGTIRITVQFASPLPPGQVRAEARCRDRESGRMMDVSIRP